MIYSPTNQWISTGISKDDNRLVFTLNRVVDGYYNNYLKCWRSSVHIVQIKINKGKEEIRIVKYLLLMVAIIYTLDEAKRNK
jgi:hypothetical protein